MLGESAEAYLEASWGLAIALERCDGDETGQRSSVKKSRSTRVYRMDLVEGACRNMCAQGCSRVKKREPQMRHLRDAIGRRVLDHI